ncbi:hypothetical protein F443_05568 [Phytophthora nicotianae P1569]|uniref:Uncharacterized protein n=1 Tax=Phytophthora nicotianae P1569 TaxID=1317065 RepID=V9FKR2_PHYNI|nr:hypothetical protein F443_05568 [Phytophthora nicotianae P1569]
MQTETSQTNEAQQLQAAASTQVYNPALDEVLNQLDEEDELASHGVTDDMDYEEDQGEDVVDTKDVVETGDASAEDEPNAHRKRKKKLNQNLVHHSADEDEVVAGSFLEGFTTFLESWDLFDKVFADFQEQTFQLFSRRTNTSVKARNRKIASEQAKQRRMQYRGRREEFGQALAYWRNTSS